MDSYTTYLSHINMNCMNRSSKLQKVISGHLFSNFLKIRLYTVHLFYITAVVGCYVHFPVYKYKMHQSQFRAVKTELGMYFIIF